MAKAKVSPVMEEADVAVAAVEETQSTEMVVSGFSGGGLANAVESEALSGQPPFLKVDRNSAEIKYDKDIVLATKGQPLRMLVLEASAEYYTPWNMCQREDKSYYRPRWKTIKEGINSKESKANLVENGALFSDLWVEKVGPSIIPAMDFIVSVQSPEGVGTEFDGNCWVTAVLSCCAREKKLAEAISTKAKINPRCAEEPWRMEWALDSYLVSSNGNKNYYLTASLKAVHAEDSDFAKEYRATCG